MGVTSIQNSREGVRQGGRTDIYTECNLEEHADAEWNCSFLPVKRALAEMMSLENRCSNPHVADCKRTVLPVVAMRREREKEREKLRVRWYLND